MAGLCRRDTVRFGCSEYSAPTLCNFILLLLTDRGPAFFSYHDIDLIHNSSKNNTTHLQYETHYIHFDFDDNALCCKKYRNLDKLSTQQLDTLFLYC